MGCYWMVLNRLGVLPSNVIFIAFLYLFRYLFISLRIFMAFKIRAMSKMKLEVVGVF